MQEDLFSEDLGNGLPKIKLTAQAKKGEEWLKKNLFYGKTPTRILVNRFLNNDDLLTNHEESIIENYNWDDFNKICMQAYAKCLIEWFEEFNGPGQSNSGLLDYAVRAGNIALFRTIFFDLLSTSEDGLKDEQSPEDLLPADIDDELPKITLTAQAKKGEEWLKKNLCNGQDPARFLLNRYLNNIPIMTQDEMEKFALSINIHDVKAYLECYEEWVASFVEYKLNENSANISNQDGQE